jgi:hypothetical protein
MKMTNDDPYPPLNIKIMIGVSINFGGARRDRTADLNTASVALSQLSYGPLLHAVMK